MLKGAKRKWTVFSLRDKVLEYIVARENSERKGNPSESLVKGNTPNLHESRNRPLPAVSDSRRNFPSHPGGRVFHPMSNAKREPNKQLLGSAEALVVNTKQQTKTRYYDQCRYCEERHWSDECPKYRTVAERKRQLKDSCAVISV